MGSFRDQLKRTKGQQTCKTERIKGLISLSVTEEGSLRNVLYLRRFHEVAEIIVSQPIIGKRVHKISAPTAVLNDRY